MNYYEVMCIDNYFPIGSDLYYLPVRIVAKTETEALNKVCKETEGSTIKPLSVKLLPKQITIIDKAILWLKGFG